MQIGNYGSVGTSASSRRGGDNALWAKFAKVHLGQPFVNGVYDGGPLVPLIF